MSKEAMKLALEVLKINLTLLKKINPYKGQEDLLSDSLDLTNKAITTLETELEKPDFWEGYVPEPVKSAQCAPAEDGVCEALDCSNHKPAQQEPVACVHKTYSVDTATGKGNCLACGAEGEMRFIVDTSPQPAQQEYASFAEWAHDYVQDNLHKLKPAQRKPLTDEELYKVFPAIATYTEANKTLYRSIARAIEAAHGIKE